MIIELLLTPIFLLVGFIINLIPATQGTGMAMNGFFGLVSKGLYFFSASTFKIVITNVVIWGGIHLAWAIIEWVYKKIPGVD